MFGKLILFFIFGVLSIVNSALISSHKFNASSVTEIVFMLDNRT